MQKLRESLPHLPKGPGVYIFKDGKGVPLYVGKSTNVAERVKSHLGSTGPKARGILKQAASVQSIPVDYELEALLLEARLIQKYKPRFNSRAKDDKHPLYIKISKDEFPVVSTTRLEDDKMSCYFGPFPASTVVRGVLKQLRKIFPYHSQKVGKKPCFYSHLGLCTPCPSIITKTRSRERKKLEREYRANIQNLTRVLAGKTDKVKRSLAKNMLNAAAETRFEEAARLRDQLQKLEYITAPYRPASAYLENPNLVADIRCEEVSQLSHLLKAMLKKEVYPKRIECFDVAQLRGRNATASMVTFIDAEPEKNFYRHFRIRQKPGDDTAAMGEVLQRRIGHFKDWGTPDLFIVDGGKGQISAGVQVLRQANVNIPLVGLAKRNEEIIGLRYEPSLATYTFRKIKLARDSAALQLLQRIRDEAHRFARSYHLKLRIKALHNG